MTDNHKEHTHKTADCGCSTAHAVHDDVKTSTHTPLHKDADVKTQGASSHEKTGVHKDVSADPKFKDHNMHKDAEMKTQSASVHEKTGSHKDVSADSKVAAHPMHKDADGKTENASVHEKTDIHKGVSADPKFKDHNMHKDAEMKAQDASGHEKTGSHKDTPVEPKVAAQNKIEFYAQITGALASAKFPLKTAADLISAFPKGAATAYHVGNFRMTAGEAGNLLKPADFPFVNAKAVVDMISQRASL